MSRHGNRRIGTAYVTQHAVVPGVIESLRVVTGHRGTSSAKFFPDLGPRFKVSLHGGRSPVWSPDGSELFFRDYKSSSLMAVEVRAGDDFDVGAYASVFDDAFADVASGTAYDVHPDGDRFVFVRLGGAIDGSPTVVVTNALARNR